MEFTNVGKTAAKLSKSPIFIVGIIAIVGYVLFRKITLGNTTIGSTAPMNGGGGIDTQTVKDTIDAAISDYDTSLESRLMQFDDNIQGALSISTNNLESEISSTTDAITQQVEQNKIEADNELGNVQKSITQIEQPAPTYNMQPVGQPITTITEAKTAWNLAHAAGDTAGELAAHAAADKIRGYPTNSSGTARISEPITTIAAAKTAWNLAHATGNRAGEAAAHAAADRIRGHRTNSSGTARLSQPINSIAAAKTAWNLAHARGDRAGEAAAHAAADRIRGHRTNSSGTNE